MSLQKCPWFFINNYLCQEAGGWLRPVHHESKNCLARSLLGFLPVCLLGWGWGKSHLPHRWFSGHLIALTWIASDSGFSSLQEKTSQFLLVSHFDLSEWMVQSSQWGENRIQNIKANYMIPRTFSLIFFLNYHIRKLSLLCNCMHRSIETSPQSGYRTVLLHCHHKKPPSLYSFVVRFH